MPGADKTFKVRVETEASGTGIQQTEADLARLKQQSGTVPIPGGPTPPITGAAADAVGAITSEAEGAAAAFGGLSAVALPALGGIVLAGRQVLNTLRDISEFQAHLTEEIGKEVIALDKATAKWQEQARAADSLKDVNRIASEVVTSVEAMAEKTRQLGSESLTLGQTFKEAFIVLVGLTQGIPQIWTPYTTALKEAQTEQEKLNALMIESGRVAIETAQQTTAIWDAVKLEPVARAIDEVTKSLQAQKDAAAAANLSTKQGQEDFAFYTKNALELQAHRDELIKIQDRLSSSSDRVAESLEKINLDKLSKPDQLNALKTKLDEIKQSLRELGIDAESPNEALKQSGNLAAEGAEEAIKLAGAWAQVSSQIDKTSTEIQKASADWKKLHDETLSATNAQLAIDRARAAGNEDLAKKLERQRDLLKEITDLMAKGLSYDEASAAAKEKQNIKRAAELEEQATAGPGGAQARAILANEKAARDARAAGNERDADLFQKTADELKRNAPGAAAQLDQVKQLRGEIPTPGAPIPGGRAAGPGESQDAVNDIERNRLNFEKQLRGDAVSTAPPSQAQPQAPASSAEIVSAIQENTGILRAIQQLWS